MLECKICNNKINNKEFNVREMMYGYREEFKYFECGNCGCLQILEVPKDIQKYYDTSYYSFNKNQTNQLIKKIKTARDKFAFQKRGLFGNLLVKIFGYPDFINWLRHCDINPSDRILDIGSGDGYLLEKLSNLGFQNLVGLDPFIQKPIYLKNYAIYKKDIFQIEDEFDFIMMHHSFEHMREPINVLSKINRLLKKNGELLIRIPVADSYAWKTFNINWAQIDAPRHFFLHTVKSLEIISEKSGFKMTKTIFDSTDFQFWASEQYKQGIPLLAPNSYFIDKKKSLFNEQDILLFKKEAARLNREGMGDQACFYFTKI